MLRRVRPNSSLLIHPRRIEPLLIFRGLLCVLIRKPDSRLTFGRIWQDVSCLLMALIRREIACLSGIRMSQRRNRKVFGSEELSYLRKEPWCWLKFIVRYFGSISRRFAVMETHGMMWQFLLSLSNREALLMKRYAVTLRDAPHRRRHSSESVTGFLNKRVPGSVMNMRFASILSLLVRATSLRSRHILRVSLRARVILDWWRVNLSCLVNGLPRRFNPRLSQHGR